MEGDWRTDREKMFVLMLIGTVVLTLVLSGLIVADLTGAHKPVAAQLGPGGVATDNGGGTDQSGGGGAGGSATPGAGGSAANGAGGGSSGAAGGGGGSSGKKGGGGAAAGVPTVSCANCGVQGHTLLLGSIVTVTGPGRSIGIAHALQAWVQSVNRAGGINGYTIQFDLRDDAGNADVGASEYKDFAEGEHVLAVLGECAPITDEPMIPYINRQQLIVVGECQSGKAAYLPAAPNVQSQGQYIWVTGPRPDQNGNLGAKLTIDKLGWGGSKVGVLCLDQSSTLPVCEGTVNYYQGKVTLDDPGGAHKEDIAGNDYAAVIGHYQGDGVQHLNLVIEPGNLQRFLGALDNTDYHPQMYCGLVIDDGSVGANGHKSADGMYQGTPWTPLNANTPGMQRLGSTMHAYYPDDKIDLYAQTGWASGLVFEHAMQMMGNNVSKQNLLNVLNAFNNWDNGLGEVENYSASNHLGRAEASMMQLHGAGTDGWHLDGVPNTNVSL